MKIRFANVVLIIAILVSSWITYDTLVSLSAHETQPDYDALIDKALDYRIANEHGKAARILKPLSEKGIARAQLYMAASYYHGHGVEKDYKKAKQLFLELKEKGYESRIVDTYLNLLGMVED
jgi:TPR repeat protein